MWPGRSSWKEVGRNVESILRTVFSANQLSINGPPADMCREVSKDTMASRKPEAHDLLESMEIPTNLLLPTFVSMNSDGETCCKNTSNNSNNYLTTRSYPNYAPTLVQKLSKEDNISSHLMQKDQAEWYICAQNVRCLVTIRELEQEAGFVGIRKLAQS